MCIYDNRDNSDCISVIVSVYNAEKYLERCIESIRKQTYENIEIILVDDGSTDDSGKILDDYKKIDRRIKVVHKENGVNDPVNVGVSLATGQFIAIVDDDDYIAPEMYARLYETIIADGSDMVICNCAYVDEEENDLNVPSPLNKYECITAKEGLKRLSMPMGNYYVTMWNRLYKNSLLKSTPIPTDCLNGDNCVAHIIIDKCSKISLLSDVLYFYTQREGSQSRMTKGYKYFDNVESYVRRIDYYISRKYYDLLPEGVQEMIGIYRQIRRRYITKERNKMGGLKIARRTKKAVKRIVLYCKSIGIIDRRYMTSISDISIIKCIVSDKIEHMIKLVFIGKKSRITDR